MAPGGSIHPLAASRAPRERPVDGGRPERALTATHPMGRSSWFGSADDRMAVVEEGWEGGRGWESMASGRVVSQSAV